MVRGVLLAMLFACGDAGSSPGPDIELLVHDAIVIFPQGPTSARVAAHHVIVELSPCPSKPVEVAGSFGDAPADAVRQL